MPYSRQGGLTLGDLGFKAIVLPGAVQALEVDELFRADRSLRGVVIDGPDGPGLLSRDQLEFKMSGRLGYGRALHSRATAADLLAGSNVTVPAGLGITEAIPLILERPETTRYQDLLVLGESGPRIVPVSEVFESLSAVFRHASLHDPLTALPNRRMLEIEAPSLTRGTDRSQIGVLFIDLDDFKGVNDTYGHRTGDIILAQFAGRLTGCVRAGDTVVRLGGDEFAVLLVGADEREAGAVADRVLRCMDEHFVVDGHHLDVTATIGLAMTGDLTGDSTGDSSGERTLTGLEALLRHADGAMLEAKQAGKRRVGRICPTGNPTGFARGALIRRRLPHALDQGALSLEYQPLQDLATGAVHGVEALLRWRDPELGQVSPAEFIPVAEHTGEILRIGAWVIDAACAQARTWSDDGTPLKVSVNVSPVQLAPGTLVEDVTEALEAHGIPGGLLEIEITEGTAITDLTGAALQLRQLIDAGVGVALDDYGTAHSTPTLLRVLPLTGVKIDKSFIEDIDTDKAAAAIISGIIHAMHSLGIKITAEGIERPAQLAVLQDMGCDTGQGYLISRPVAAADVPEACHSRNRT